MTLRFNWRAALVLALLSCFWGWVASAFAQSVAGPDAPMRGDQVTYLDEAGHRWCVTITAFDTGADARPWAWLVSRVGPPHALLHAPVSELRAGCSQ